MGCCDESDWPVPVIDCSPEFEGQAMERVCLKKGSVWEEVTRRMKELSACLHHRWPRPISLLQIGRLRPVDSRPDPSAALDRRQRFGNDQQSGHRWLIAAGNEPDPSHVG